MRIVAGRHRGRRLTAPWGDAARPTADRAREALFNILAHWDGIDLDGARVVDCFAGTGALGLEALSRGAAHATFVENNPSSLAVLGRNIDTLGERGRTTIIRADATRLPPAELPCRLAFLDPPYHSGLALPCLTGLAHRGWLGDNSLGVVEVAAKEEFTPLPGFDIVDERTYGAARLIFVRRR